MTQAVTLVKPLARRVVESIAIELPPVFGQAAKHFAAARTQGHNHCRKQNEDLGGMSKNFDADFWGVLSEFAVIYAMQRSGFRPKGYVLVADRAPVGPDFVLGDVRYSVKCCPPGKQFLSINERQRTDPKHEVDYFLPTVAVSDSLIRVFHPIKAAEVASWPLREGRSLYRSLPISELGSLDLWEVIPGAMKSTGIVLNWRRPQ